MGCEASRNLKLLAAAQRKSRHGAVTDLFSRRFCNPDLTVFAQRSVRSSSSAQTARIAGVGQGLQVGTTRMKCSCLHRWMRIHLWAGVWAWLLCCLGGCQTAPPAPGVPTVATHLTKRVGHSLPCQTGLAEII